MQHVCLSRTIRGSRPRRLRPAAGIGLGEQCVQRQGLLGLCQIFPDRAMAPALAGLEAFSGPTAVNALAVRGAVPSAAASQPTVENRSQTGFRQAGSAAGSHAAVQRILSGGVRCR